jgi:hypothetical protein
MRRTGSCSVAPAASQKAPTAGDDEPVIEDVVVDAEHAGVGGDVVAGALGHRDDDHPCPVARLERADAQRGEQAFAVAGDRAALAQQGPLEIDVQRARGATSRA